MKLGFKRSPQEVQVLGGGVGTANAWIPLVLDLARLRYRTPTLDSTSPYASLREYWKPLLPDKFDNGESAVVAIVDSGLMSEHPWIAGQIDPSRTHDCTAEGTVEDLCGHGTLVALLFLSTTPAPPKLINVKVTEADGRGSTKTLRCGLAWLTAYQRAHPNQRVTANMSVGVFRTTLFGLRPCRGRCSVCRAAIRTARAGVTIVAAAGNTPGRTACPATAGLRGRHPGIVAMGAMVEGSGKGEFLGPGTVPPFDDHSITAIADNVDDPERQSVLRSALKAYERGDALGRVESTFMLGVALVAAGNEQEALRAFTKAAAAGFMQAEVDAGVILRRRGETDAAERAYRRADEAGISEGSYNLGVVLKERGETSGALAAYRRADQLGMSQATFNLASLLAELGDEEGAEAAYRRAADNGHAGAANNLGALLQQRGNRADAIDAYRHSDKLGSADGSYNLALILLKEGDEEGAQAALHRADERGHREAPFVLGTQAENRGDIQSAETYYRRADRRGSASAAFNLGILLRNAGDLAGAEAAWRRGDERGHAGAAHDLGLLFYHRGDKREARTAWERAATRGDERAYHNLQVLAREE